MRWFCGSSVCFNCTLRISRTQTEKNVLILMSESWKNLVLLLWQVPSTQMIDILALFTSLMGGRLSQGWFFSGHYNDQCFEPYLINVLPHADLQLNSEPASRYSKKGSSTLCELLFLQRKELLNSSFPELKLFLYHFPIFVMSIIPPVM